ncbi:MAG TPA: response regulator [Chitinophagaceae bacterium]|nr:response regulator [Chitinophagaceae bacterium]
MNPSKKTYSVLIIEDSPADQFLLEESLNSTGLSIEVITMANSIAEAMHLLETHSFSIIFLDLFLPDSSGLDTLIQLVKLYSKTPIIISSGLSDTQVAVNAISMGAQDFLIKGDYSSALLEKTFVYSIERKDAEQLIKASEESYRYLFDNNPAIILLWDLDDFKILKVNETAIKIYGYTKEEFLQKTLLDICRNADHKKVRIAGENLMKNKKASGIWKHINKKGKVLNMDTSSHIIIYNGKEAVLTLANDITEKVFLEEKLAEEKIKKQQEINAAIITAQVQERSLLGEELHDNINQILATATLYMDGAISNEESRINFLKEGKGFIKNAMEEIRKLSKTLLPPSLGEGSLHEALNNVIEKIKMVNDNIHFVVDWKVKDEDCLNDKLKLSIFRIVQEQLNNIFKHAKASNINIRLEKEDEFLQLSIKDDGIGFDPSKKAEGVGLQNIVNRAKLLNGTTLIKSSVGKGCEIVINFSFKNSIPVALAFRA